MNLKTDHSVNTTRTSIVCYGPHENGARDHIQKHEYKHKLVCGQRLIEFGWSVGGQYSLNTNATSRQAIPMHIVCLFWCRNLQS